ncbi:MAG: hypothetical protein E7271_09265 [Lachnospiraceae bacterium]|jgi:hypothetical protein|nr:hypothetical protein [Lachnospiraceae bacterium]
MNRSSEIRKRKKKFLSFVLSVLLVVGLLYVPMNAADTDQSVWTCSGETSSYIFTYEGKQVITDDNENKRGLDEIDRMVSKDSGILVSGGYTIGNKDMVVDGSVGGVEIGEGNKLICGSLSGSIKNNGTLKIGTLDTSKLTSFYNNGVVEADDVVLTVVQNTSAAKYNVAKSFKTNGYNSQNIGTVVAKPNAKISSDGGTIYLVVGSNEASVSNISTPTEAWKLMPEDTDLEPVELTIAPGPDVSDGIPDDIHTYDDGSIYVKKSFKLSPPDGYAIGNDKSDYTIDGLIIDGDKYQEIKSDSDKQFLILKLSDYIYTYENPNEGNTNFANIHFDSVDPTITSAVFSADGKTITAPAEGETVEAKILKITLTANDPNLIPEIAYKFGADEMEQIETMSSSGASYTGTIKMTSDSSAVKDCYYKISDKSGNVASLGFKLQYPKEAPEVSVTCSDVYVGDTIKPVVTTNPSSLAEEVTYEYKGKKEPDTSYTSEVPVKAGEYTLKATTKENSVYKSKSATCDFSILKKKISAKVSVADNYVGDSYEPKVTVDPVVDVKAKYMYKASGTPDDAYSTTKPTKAGTYYVKAILSYDTDKYEMLDCESSFKISKKKPKSSVKISEQKEDKDYTPTLTTDSDGKNKAVFEYKKKDADDSTYSKTKPKTHGSYTVRATIPETDKYLAATCEADYVITKVDDKNDSVIYQLSGDKGKNGYYKSDVYIVAPKGYKFASSKDGKYSDKIKYTNDLKKIYVKRTSDDEILEPIDFDEEIKIDKELPKLAGTLNGEAVSLTDGKELYADNLTISISDENLAKVTLDGEEVSVDSKTVTLQLDSEMGEKTFNITTEDEAGNENNIKLVLKSEWLKNKIIPGGKKVKLRSGDVYTLEPGAWVVAGDSTVYNGGQEFFVTSSGDYTFEKQ